MILFRLDSGSRSGVDEITQVLSVPRGPGGENVDLELLEPGKLMKTDENWWKMMISWNLNLYQFISICWT